MKLKYYIILWALFITSCASNDQFLVVDPSTVKDEKKLDIDREQCIQIAAQFDLGGEVAGKAVAGAAIGSMAVAGIATAVAGAVFAPAMPFIIAGGALPVVVYGVHKSQKKKEKFVTRS